MASIDSVPHTNCTLERGPGARGTDCGMCREPMGADEATICHTECLHSFHMSCLTGWSRTLRFDGKAVTCPACRRAVTEARNPRLEPDTWPRAWTVSGGRPDKRVWRLLFPRRPRLAIAQEFDWLPYAQLDLGRLGGYVCADAIDLENLLPASRERLAVMTEAYGIVQFFPFIQMALFNDPDACLADRPVDVYLVPDHAHVRAGGPFQALPPVDPRLLGPYPDDMTIVSPTESSRVDSRAG